MNTWKISAALSCLLLASSISAQQQSVIVIQGATLINGTGSPAIRNSAIVIEGGRIRDIGPRNEVKVPGGVQTVDARGKWVIPGLIDAHVHFSQSGGEYVGLRLLPDLLALGQAHAIASPGGAWPGTMPPSTPSWSPSLDCQ